MIGTERLLVVVDVELEDVSPVFRFRKGLEGLAFAGGENDPSGAWILLTVEDCFRGAGVVFTCLSGPKSDFEARLVRCKSGLVGQQFEVIQFVFGVHSHPVLIVLLGSFSRKRWRYRACQ